MDSANRNRAIIMIIGALTLDLMAQESPPEGYNLNILCVKVSKHITDQDLKDLKTLVRGEGGLEVGTLEKCIDALDFLHLLERRGMVTASNILVLQILVWKINNYSLYNQILKAVEDDIVHMGKPTTVSENGIETVRWPLIGNIGKDLGPIKETVAKWFGFKTANDVMIESDKDKRYIILKSKKTREVLASSFDACKPITVLDIMTERMGHCAKHTDLKISKPELQFFVIDDALKVNHDGTLVEVIKTEYGKAWTDGRFATDSVYWEIEFTLYPDPDQVGVCRSGAISCDPHVRDHEYYYIEMRYHGDKFFWDSSHGDINNDYAGYFTNHIPQKFRLGFYLDTNTDRRRWVVLDSETRTIIAEKKYSKSSYRRLKPYVEFGAGKYSSAEIIPPDRTLPANILEDILHL